MNIAGLSEDKAEYFCQQVSTSYIFDLYVTLDVKY